MELYLILAGIIIICLVAIAVVLIFHIIHLDEDELSNDEIDKEWEKFIKSMTSDKHKY